MPLDIPFYIAFVRSNQIDPIFLFEFFI